MIYTTTSWWTTCTGNSASFGQNNPLWIARWASSVGTLPSGWSYVVSSLLGRVTQSESRDYFSGSGLSGRIRTTHLRILETTTTSTEMRLNCLGSQRALEAISIDRNDGHPVYIRNFEYTCENYLESMIRASSSSDSLCLSLENALCEFLARSRR